MSLQITQNERSHTDVHFWYRFSMNFQHRIVVHHDLVLEQRHIDTCNNITILDSIQYQTCLESQQKLIKLPKNTRKNTELLRRKKASGCWSNRYLRFPWIIERW